jgi:hypothetical protein
MGLTQTFISEVLEPTLESVQKYFERRKEEVDDQVTAMRGFSVSLSEVGEPVVEVASNLAAEDIEELGLQVTG